MDKVISFLVSVVTFFMSVFGIALKDPVLPADTENFVPVVRFFSCCDTHVTEDYEESNRAGRIVKLFNAAYDFAEKDANYKKLDAAMFVGDCTNDGTDKQFEIFADEINRGKREGTQILAVAADHHDGYIGEKCLEQISKITGLDSDFHVVINGFHFIGISAAMKYDVGRYTESQRIWLRQQLKKAAADDPDKPIFVCNHEHVYNTVYGSNTLDTWGTPYFEDILSQYPQVVHFSGHSHYPLNDPRSIVQGAFTAVGAGSMYYAEFRYKAKIKIRPHGNICAQAWVVEADKDDNVRLTGLDVNTSEVLCQYVIPAKCERSERVFTRSNLRALSSPPAFDDDAKLDVVNNNDGTYTVTTPAAHATDRFIVFVYRIRVFDSVGLQKHTEYFVNNYYTTDSFSEVSFTIDAKAGDRVEVTAENAYYMSSAPLSASIS